MYCLLPDVTLGASLRRFHQRCRAIGFPCAAVILAVGIFSLATSTVHAAGSLATWRRSVTDIRVLAENNVPVALLSARELEASMPPDANPVDRASILNLLARVEIYAAQIDQAASHAEKALALAVQHADRVGQAEAELNLSVNTIYQGRINEMVVATKHGLEALDGVDRPDLLGEALLRTAAMHLRLGQLDECVSTSIQAMEIARRSGDHLALTYAYQGKAIAFDQSGHAREAYEHYLQMYQEARQAKVKLQEAYALAGVGSASRSLGDLIGAEKYTREAIALFRNVGTPFGINFGLFALAGIFEQKRQHREALAVLGEVEASYARYSNPIGAWYTLNALSSNHQALGETAAAESAAQRALALAEQIRFPYYLGESKQRLATFAAARSDYRQAYALTVEAGGLATRAVREKTEERMAQLTQHYESVSRRHQLDALLRQSEQQKQQLQRHALETRWLWTIIIFGLVLMIGVVSFLLRLRRANQLQELVNQQLQQSRSEFSRQTKVLRSILDSMGDGVVVANVPGEIFLLNPVAAQLFGIEVDGDGKINPQCRDIYWAAGTPDHEQSASAGAAPDIADWRRPTSKPADGYWIQLSTEASAGEGLFQGAVAVFSAVKVHLPETGMRYSTSELPLARAMRGVSSDGVEVFIPNSGSSANGRWLSVTARPLLDKAGAISGGVAIFSDVTAQKEAEILLQRSEQKFRTLAENSPDVIVRYDRAGQRQYVNPAYERISGAAAPQALQNPLEQLWRGLNVTAAEYRAILLNVMATRESAQLVLQWQPPQASPLMVYRLQMVPECNPDGEVIGALSIGHDITSLKQTEYQLEESLKLLRELTSRRETAREEERKRIAREIHDELGQKLTALRMQVSMLRLRFGGDNPQLVGAVHDMIMLIDDTLATVRAVATALRPAVLNMGLVAALDWLVAEFRYNTGVPCLLHLPEGEVLLDDERAIEVFRIVQESLTNIARHAQATHADVVVCCNGNAFSIDIQDNGCGFVPELTRSSALGLLGMRERGHALGGVVTVVSEPGQGTTIRVQVNQETIYDPHIISG